MFTPKYYNVEIPANTKEMIHRIETFKCWLYDYSLKFETSGAWDHIHFEIFITDQNILDDVNNALDGLVFFDCIKASA